MRPAVVVVAILAIASCSSPASGVCSPEERCGDGIDNDCDGMIDEGCECTPGDIRECGAGDCAGQQLCDTGTWSQCYGGSASAEICDGKDNDCDGVIDNGDNGCGGVCDLPGVPATPCDGPDTDACAEGTWQCTSANAVTCSDMTGSTVELCGDGIDNNCDGRIDEYCAGAMLLWADHGGSAIAGAFAQANDVAVASDGSIYIVGSHEHVVTFGGTVTWDAGSNSDGFIVKYSAAGQLLWHRPISGPGDASADAIAVDSDGSIVVAGSFGGYANPATVQFSSTVSATPAGGHDAFIARYQADGTFGSLATFASDQDDDIAALAIGPSGRIAITGQFVGTALHLGNTSVPRAGFSNTYFAAELDASFAPRWARRVEYAGTTTGDLGGKAVAFDAGGNVYVGGSAVCYTNCIAPMLAVNRGEADELVIPAAAFDHDGGFLVRLSSTGAVAWATASPQFAGIAIDGTALYATGSFGGVTVFGLGLATQTTLVPGGNTDGWIGRYGTDGTFAWAHQFGSTTSCGGIGGFTDDAGLGVAIDAAGHPIIAGRHQATLHLASDLDLAGDGYGNMFWAAFDPAGAVEWGHNGKIGELPCTGGGAARRVAIAPDGDVVVVGNFNAHLILPTTTLAGPNDFFVAVFSSQ